MLGQPTFSEILFTKYDLLCGLVSLTCNICFEGNSQNTRRIQMMFLPRVQQRTGSGGRAHSVRFVVRSHDDIRTGPKLQEWCDS